MHFETTDNQSFLSRACGFMLGKSIVSLPAWLTDILDKQKNHIRVEQIKNDSTVKISFFKVSDSEGASLDTVEVKAIDLLSPKFYIIRFDGMGMFFKGYLDEIAEDAINLECIIRGFNYRGIGESNGSACSAQDLINDGIKQVRHLLDSNVDPRHIVLQGHSLGSAIAIKVAEYFKINEGKKLLVYSTCGFSSLSYAAALSAGKMGNNLTFSATCKRFFEYAKWEIDAAEAYRNLDEDQIDYIVIKPKKGTVINLPYQEDNVIDHNASLYKQIKVKGDKEENRSHKFCIFSNYARVEHSDGRGVEHSEHTPGHKIRKKYWRNSYNPNLTAEEHFKNFINKRITL